MGQQASRKTNHLHGKIPSFVHIKDRESTQKPEEPIKFQYHLPKRGNDKQRNTLDEFGINTISNLKTVLDGVKNKCNELNGCTKKDLKEDHVNESYNLQKVQFFTSNKTNINYIECEIDEKQVIVNNNNNNNNKSSFRESKFHDVIKMASSDLRKSTKHRVSKNEKKIKKGPLRTKSEPNLRNERSKDRMKQRQHGRNTKNRKLQEFGYEIQDVDKFLAKATLSKPANIPVVLALSTVLYHTRMGGYQAEIPLPLGMVVNAIFRNQNWLYVQTPHAEEGYVSYSACLPLGIIPPLKDDKLSPCWEKSTDVFPKPCGNMTDNEKGSYHSENEEEPYCPRTRYRTALSTCGEKSVDRLYLRAAAIAKGKGTRHTLLVTNEDYKATGQKILSVSKNEVVFLLNANIPGWFYVKNKDGREGFIPSAIAGHGFL